MEDALRKELEELCQQIIDNSQSDELQDLLPRVQLIEEKLILYKYLRFRQTELENRRGQGEVSQSPISRKLDAELEQTLTAADLQSQSRTPSPLERPIFAAESSPEPSADDLVEEKSEQASGERGSQAPAPTEPPSPRQRETLANNEEPKLEPAVSASPDQSREARPEPASNRQAAPITLGLNDRISFTNNLFDGSQQDLNRVISQLNTFGSYREAESFINQMVKPDYDWTDKSDYEERLFDLVKARFGES